MITVAVFSIIAAPLTIHVSPDGNDENFGTASKPVRSLYRAQALARRANKTAPIEILVQPGTYRLGQTLEFGEKDSGKAGYPVVWKGKPGGRVILSGGVEIGGWSTTKVNGRTAWTTTVPGVKEGRIFFRSLYGIDGKRRLRSRYPATGFLSVRAVDKPQTPEESNWLAGKDQFFYRPDEVRNWPDATEGEVVMYTQWCDAHIPIKKIDEENQKILCTKASIQNISEKNKYIISNLRAGLLREGDWTLCRKTGTLTYIPMPGESIAKTNLIAPSTQRLLSLNGAHHLTFSGFEVRHADWWFPDGYVADTKNGERVWGFQQAASNAGAAVEATNISDVSFTRCTFANLGANALNVGGASRSVTIQNCTFTDLGAGAAKIGDKELPANYKPEDLTQDILFSDNEVAHGSQMFEGAAGVLVMHARRVSILHNYIHNLTYTGVSCGWDWGFDRQATSRDNIIAWNHIHDIHHDVIGDGGGIYMLGVQPGTTIEYNRIHDVRGGFASRGIYLDDGSSEMVVRKNLSYRNRTSNFFQWRSRQNVVENNVFAFGGDSQIELSGAVYNGGGNALGFRKNIILLNDSPVLNPFQRTDVKSIYAWDRNLYWKPSGATVVPQDHLSVGWDKNSVVADPRLANPLGNNFRFLGSSPALAAIGFEPVDWSGVGIRK